MTDIE
jgi:hypothetical protein